MFLEYRQVYGTPSAHENSFRFALPHQPMMDLDTQEVFCRFDDWFKKDFDARNSMVTSPGSQNLIFDDFW